MKFRRLAGLLALIVAGVGLYCVYAPDTAEKWSPTAGGYARRLNALLPEAFKARPQQPASAAPREAPPAPVSVARAERADFPLYLEGLGQVQAYNTVTVRTRVDGQVVKIGFAEGQMVEAGDLVAQIDPRPYQAALDQAKAKKSQDDANLANAKLDLQRYATLAKQSFATQQQLDTQSAMVSQLIAQIAADAAAIDAAAVQLDYTTIRAPISGRTGFRLVDEGNIVAAAQQTGIVTIAQLQPIAVVFTAPQDEVARINRALAAGAPEVKALNSADSTPLADGRLTVTDNQVDAAAGSIRLKAEFANKDSVLWPGLAVSTRLTVGTLGNVVVVPEAALQRGPDGLFVYVVDDRDRAVLRPVIVRRQDQDRAVIEKGVDEGERVITAGQYVIQNGSPVAVSAATASGS
ncbi:MAG: efflux RND transporter periplasmic adaptor subunit [Roseiarcus sp.]|jgi:multidrug efflux system membrane fusion protein